MHSLEASGFADFDRMAAMFRRTLDLLDVVSSTHELPADAAEVIATETLPHVDDIEQGFRVWLRAGAVDLAELRTLVSRAGMHTTETRNPAEARAALIETMNEMGATARSHIIPAPARALAALEHARLVFALLPLTPAEEVHYPAGRRTYADISPPRRPAELAERIEELERSLWSLATQRAPSLADASYRRTYGFFDAAARISGSHFLPS